MTMLMKRRNTPSTCERLRCGYRLFPSEVMERFSERWSMDMRTIVSVPRSARGVRSSVIEMMARVIASENTMGTSSMDAAATEEKRMLK